MKISTKQDQLESGQDDSSKKTSKRGLSAEKRAVKHMKRDNLERDSTAPDQLKVVSQPSKEHKVKDLKNFVYQKEPGKGVTVYIFDWGMNKNHDVGVLYPCCAMFLTG